MEALYVLNYIYENRERLEYRIISAEDELSSKLGDNKAKKWIAKFFNRYHGGRLGILEFSCDMVTLANCDGLARIFSENHIIISRCDRVSLFNIFYVNKFIKSSRIKILVVSQNHIYLPFGFSGKFKFVMKNTFLDILRTAKK